MRYVWRGRLRRQIERVFMAYPGEPLPTGLVMAWAWPKRDCGFRSGQYERLRERLREVADPVGRATTKGRPLLWRLREPVE
jgi:hypothetical protein